MLDVSAKAAEGGGITMDKTEKKLIAAMSLATAGMVITIIRLVIVIVTR